MVKGWFSDTKLISESYRVQLILKNLNSLRILLFEQLHSCLIPTAPASSSVKSWFGIAMSIKKSVILRLNSSIRFVDVCCTCVESQKVISSSR